MRLLGTIFKTHVWKKYLDQLRSPPNSINPWKKCSNLKIQHRTSFDIFSLNYVIVRPKSWREPTKIRHISKNSINKSWSPSQLFFTRKKQFGKIQLIFDAKKWLLKVQTLQTLRRLFIILDGLAMTWFSESMLIFNVCRHGLMPNLFKKSCTVSIHPTLILNLVKSLFKDRRPFPST